VPGNVDEEILIALAQKAEGAARKKLTINDRRRRNFIKSGF